MNVTKKSKTTVAILYSGGDAPAMNMHLRCSVRIGLNRHEATVIGVKDGYAGLVRTCQRLQRGHLNLDELELEINDFPGKSGLARRAQDLVLLDHASVQGLASQGGIILGSSRCRSFRDVYVRKQVVDLLDSLGVTTVIVVGGDGSTAGAKCLSEESSLQVLVVPATIDNDLPCTEVAIGFDTAVNNAVWAVEHCNDTANAHHRIMVVEVMGRHSGQLAEATALAAGAEIVVVPERGVMDEAKMERIAIRIENSMLHGRRHAICIVAEGVEAIPPSPRGPAAALGTYLEQRFMGDTESFQEQSEPAHAEVRVTVLGHLQRGGHPSTCDRLLASRFAKAAWNCIAREKPRSGVIGLQHGRMRLQPFDAETTTNDEEFGGDVEPTLDLYNTAKEVSAWH